MTLTFLQRVINFEETVLNVVLKSRFFYVALLHLKQVIFKKTNSTSIILKYLFFFLTFVKGFSFINVWFPSVENCYWCIVDIFITYLKCIAVSFLKINK